MSHNEHQSKRLAYLLRHSSLPDIRGWMPLADLITRHGFTAELLKDISITMNLADMNSRATGRP